jgi:hypothetical protein
MKFSLSLILSVMTLLMMTCERKSSETVVEQKIFDPGKSDPRAIKIADEVMVALGGREHYETIQYLSFRFVVEADTQKLSDWRHHWDRRNNNYRLEGITRDGDHLFLIFNLDTRKGTVFKNGQQLAGDEKREFIKRAYARYVNDTYWLLMPYKLKDPGAALQYEGVQEINDVTYDVLRLSFVDSVGLTPRNVYRVFVDQPTRLVHRWEYFETEGATPSPAWWEQWRVYNGIKLAELRTWESSNRKIRFLDIIASREVDEEVFKVSSTSTAKMP